MCTPRSVVLAAILVASPVVLPAQTEHTVVLTGANLIDGTGAGLQANRTIVIRGERIVAIAAPGYKPPVGAKVMDLAGRYLVPGFIDAHVHVATDPRGRDSNAVAQLTGAFLGGVTGVRDMAGDAIALRTLAASGQDAEKALPRIRYAAVVGGASFFADPRTRASAHGGTPGDVAWMRAIDSTTDVRAAVMAAKATGASGIKIYADLAASEIMRVTNEAHRQGLRVWSHATVYPGRPSDAINAGVDVLSHAILLYWEGAREVPARYHSRGSSAMYDSLNIAAGAMDALLRRMARDSIILDATLFVSARIETAPPGTAGMADPKRAVQWMYDVTRRAKEMGVRVAAGTDGMMPGNLTDLPNIHREMELLVTRSGFSPLEAITAATRNAAAAAGWNDAGIVAVGMRADLVILDANPLEDIRNTRRVQAVVKGGRMFSRVAESNTTR